MMLDKSFGTQDKLFPLDNQDSEKLFDLGVQDKLFHLDIYRRKSGNDKHDAYPLTSKAEN